MSGKNKKSIGIWFGGCSTEYGVSLQSAYAVITHLDKNKYEPVLIGISREGKWFLYRGEAEKILEDTWYSPEACSPVTVSMDKELHGLLVIQENGIQEIPLDAAFPVLHGKNGEDGTLQGALELAGIPLAGCSTLASAVCMEKDMAHRLAEAAGVKVPRAKTFHKSQAFAPEGQSGALAELRAAQWSRGRLRESIIAWAGEIGYPIFVKPVRAGSSFGISKVTEPERLQEAVALALEHDSLCIMEEAIEGFEVGCAVLGTEELIVGEVDEIQLSQGFFDFEEKYTLKTSDIHVPARIPVEKAAEIKETAKVIYRTLGCSCFARVDMFLTPRGDIYFNEVNTIPGFTAHSRYPNMMKAAGISFAELLDRILEQVAPQLAAGY